MGVKKEKTHIGKIKKGWFCLKILDLGVRWGSNERESVMKDKRASNPKNRKRERIFEI